MRKTAAAYAGLAPHLRISGQAIGALIIGLWMVVGAELVNSRQAAFDNRSAEALNFARAFREQADYVLRGVEGRMMGLEDRIRDSNGHFDLFQWGRENILVVPGVAEAAFIGADGRLRSTTVQATAGGTDLRDREHFSIHVDGRDEGLYVGPTVIGRLSSQPVIPVSRRVDAADGTFLGVLVVLVQPDGLMAMRKSVDLGPHGVVRLVGLDLRIRASYSLEHSGGDWGRGTSVAENQLPSVIDVGAAGTYKRASLLDGLSRITAYARVGSYPLFVTVGLEQSRELAEADSHAMIIVLFAIGATLLLIGFLVYLVRDGLRRIAYEAKLADERTRLEVVNLDLAESKARAEAANRAKSVFLANMSHELRTPLNAIIGYSELIRDQTFGPDAKPRYIEYAGYVNSSGQHLLKVITQVLDTARIETETLNLGGNALVDLRDIVQRALEPFQQIVTDKHLQVIFKFKSVIPVIADPARLGQVFTNLFSNAVKFTPAGGRITVEAKRDPVTGVTCTISDTGMGMSAEEVAIATAAFSQAEEAYARSNQGTGLG
ncbi:histidine kinase dimerization/phospho-acceptor domain-containing protein, partial [Bradyrhizobium sp.]|uniref:sensor histidine kinase n=1 Tax=Bradyrhizobium sp. TaxID=376 RepID=UPI0025BA4F1E